MTKAQALQILETARTAKSPKGTDFGISPETRKGINDAAAVLGAVNRIARGVSTAGARYWASQALKGLK